MLLGEHHHALDAKGRLIFPVRLRDDLGAQVVLQKGLEPCVVVFPPDEWSRRVAGVRELPTTNPKARGYSRFFFSQASAQQLDKQGRLTIPQGLRDYASLDRDVVVVGAGTHVEIWDAPTWERARADAEASMLEMSTDLQI